MKLLESFGTLQKLLLISNNGNHLAQVNVIKYTLFTSLICLRTDIKQNYNNTLRTLRSVAGTVIGYNMHGSIVLI